MTKNSKIVLDIIESVTCHPTAADVHRLALEGGHKMSTATVYNSLAALYREGRIRKLTNPDQPERYDKLIRHDHLVCSGCGEVSDLFLKDLTPTLEAETGKRFSSYDLTLFYTCARCQTTGAVGH